MCFADSDRLGLFHSAFARRRVPLETTRCTDRSVAGLYGKPYVLVRPDGHVAWRGIELPLDPGRLADLIRGSAT
ncbi:hypothetical protein GCM10020000_14920 [Streptomyces olivoverticillatus]